jgi:UDP-2,3-diacylglucosamine hydrolase
MNAVAFFVSDLHLSHPDDAKTLTFCQWLQDLEQQKATHLFLVGDIFDLWVADRAYFVKRFANLVQALRRLQAAGVIVHYFEGNHDLHLQKFWQGHLRAFVHTEREQFNLDGLKIWVEHGDLMNPDDRGYLFLRWLLRTPLMTWLAFHLPDRLVQKLGERASEASRRYTSNEKRHNVEEIRARIRRYADSVFARSDATLFIAGHVHVVDDYKIEVSGVERRAINLGSWFDHPRALRVTAQSVDWVTLP